MIKHMTNANIMNVENITSSGTINTESNAAKAENTIATNIVKIPIE